MKWQDLVQQAATSIFEDAAFCFVEEVVESGNVAGQGAAVRFDGPRAGHLRVTLEDAALAVAAANMLGVDGTPSEALLRDALREIANMICGRVVSKLGEEPGFYRLRPVEPGSVSGEVPVAQTVLTLDSGRSWVALWVAPDAGTAP